MIKEDDGLNELVEICGDTITFGELIDEWVAAVTEASKDYGKYVPVLHVNSEEEISKYKHLIGPKTVVIIDDLPEDD